MSRVSKPIPPLNSDVNKAIDSVKFLGDVGDTDLRSLESILSHCTADQLLHIENCSKGRDLTPITNKLWKNFYERKFGKDDVDIVVKNETFKWMDLYVAKMKELENRAKKIEDRIIQSYQKEKARKQSRQIVFCGSEDSLLSNKNPKSNRTVGFKSNTTKSVTLKKAKRELHVPKVSTSSNKEWNSGKSTMLKKTKR